MVGASSLLSVVMGVALACVAERYPTHIVMIETSAGALLIGGLALLGSVLPAGI